MKVLWSTAFGLALLAVGACSNNNGVASAGKETHISEFVEISNGLGRDVDCEAKVVIYSSTSNQGGVAVVPFIDVDPTFAKNKCGLE